MVSLLKSLFRREAVLALVIGLVTNRFLDNKKAITNPLLSSDKPPQLSLVDPNEVFTSNELSTLTTVWEDDEPEGKFLKGRHGITHYKVDRENNDTKSKKGMVILCHGLGRSLKMYQELTDILLKDGYSVLRYDYFGHGYSKYLGKNMWIQYTTDIFVDQLEDLIDHVVKEEQEDIVAFVGHSNGGVVGIAANYRWSHSNGGGSSSRKILPKLILANPALYASKPLLARIADKIPTIMTALFKNIPPSRVMIADNYLEAVEDAFGKNENGEYIYPDAFQACRNNDERVFGLVEGVETHPFLPAAILGVSSYSIPGGLLPEHKEKLSALAKSKEGEILHVWGDKDLLVPYKENVDEIKKLAEESSIMKVAVMENIGHECFFENTPMFADLILPTLNA